MDLLVLLGMGLAGLLGWRLLAPHLRRLQPEDTLASGAWLWLVGFLVQIAVAELLLPVAAGGELTGAPDDGTAGAQAATAAPPLVRIMVLQSLAGALAVGVMLILARRRQQGVRGLGLRAQRGPPALLVAIAGWLLFFPFFAAVGLLNQQIQRLLGLDEGLQASLRLFMAQPEARSSLLAWLSMTVLIPISEEVIFRGALYGGLRRLLHPALALGLSAALFGLAHEASALLPAAALGGFLAFLYERTGSLSAPILFHGLHNGLTLLMVTLLPEALT